MTTNTRATIGSASFDSDADGTAITNFLQNDSFDGYVVVDSHRIRGGFAYLAHITWNGAGSFTNDHYAKATYAGTNVYSNLDKVGVTVRSSTDVKSSGSDPRDAYRFYMVPVTGSTGTLTLDKIVNGTVTSISTLTGQSSPVIGDTISLEVIGTTLYPYINDVLWSNGSKTDSSLSTGKPGACLGGGGSATSMLDTWDGGTAAVGSPDVTVGLGGAAATSGYTAPSPEVALELLGAAATVSRGAVSTGDGLTLALVGIEITSGRGVVQAGQNHGLEITSSMGTLTPSLSYGATLTWLAITSARDSLGPRNLLPALTGIAPTITPGFVTALGNNVTVHMDGFDLSVLGGFVTGGINSLTGIALTGTSGAPVWDLSVPLLGIESACGYGAIAPEQDSPDSSIVSYSGAVGWSSEAPLLTSLMTMAQGTLSVTGDTALPLVGSAFTATGGLVGFGNSFPLVGIEVATAQQPMGAPGGATLTGLEATVIDGDVFLNDDRTFALVGEVITSTPGLAVTSYLAFATGLEITLSQERIGPITLDLTGLEMGFGLGQMVGNSPEVIHPPGGGGGHGHGHGPKKGPPPPRGHGKHRKKEAEIAGDVLEAPGVPFEDGTELPAPQPVFPPVDDDEDEAFLLL